MSLVTRPFAHLKELDFIDQNRTQNVSDSERIVCLTGGALLAAFCAVKRSPVGIVLGLLGGALLYRGGSGHCPMYDRLDINTAHPHPVRGVPGNKGTKISKSVWINRPAGALFSFWRNFENLPRFMPHLESVEETTDRISHWVVKGPLESRIEWDAEIIVEHPGQMISWQTLPGASVASAGSVWFEPEGAGTEVTVTLQYEPVAGSLGAAIAAMLGESPEEQIAGDLDRFKTLMEEKTSTADENAEA